MKLTKAYNIREAIWQATWQGGKYVYIDLPNEPRQRIVAVRTKEGKLQGRVLATNKWETITEAYTD